MTDRPNNQDAEVTSSVHPSEDELSAYINGDIVDGDELQRLQAHLSTCASCRETLSELRAVVGLLRGMEHPTPSRSFRLDPSMVPAPVVRIDPWLVRAQPVLRRLTALAAVLLLFVVVADVLAHQGGHDAQTRSVAFSSSSAQTTSSSAGAALAPAVSESTSAGSSGSAAQPSTEIPAATAAAAAADNAKASGVGTPIAAAGSLAVSTGVSSASQAAATSQTTSAPAVAPGESPPEQAPTSTPSGNAGTSYWRLVELAVGVVVIWLLFMTVALPRLVRQREP